MNGTHADADACACSLCQYERRLISKARAWKALAKRKAEALATSEADRTEWWNRADSMEQHAAEMGRLANDQGLRAERLEAALRSIGDYTQDGLNGECSLCYFKIEGLTTHKEECPWPAAVGATRTEGTTGEK